MSFFQKSKILLKKHYIIHFFGVRMRYLRTLPLCYGLVVATWSRADHYALVRKFDESSPKVRIKGPKVVKVVFRKSWFAIFGDDLNFFVGGERDWIIQYNIIYIIKTHIKI
jgi:hypothetical protein